MNVPPAGTGRATAMTGSPSTTRRCRTGTLSCARVSRGSGKAAGSMRRPLVSHVPSRTSRTVEVGFVLSPVSSSSSPPDPARTAASTSRTLTSACRVVLISRWRSM